MLLRTFNTRDPGPMMILWKSIILSRLDYCSQLWSPSNVNEIQKIESLQRTFTTYIINMNNLDYWQRIKSLKLYSIERRFERYSIIYVWKLCEDLVVKPLEFEVTSLYSRTGRRFIMKCLPNVARSTQTLIFNSPINKAMRLFNKLPANIRNINMTTVDKFKRALDKFLARVPDEPGVQGYVKLRQANSNSIADQMNYISN